MFDLTYSSNHIEGSRLTHDQTRYIFETNTIGLDRDSAINVDDIVETVNHFRCMDQVISNARRPLSEAMIKGLHCTLKAGSSDSRKPWFAVGGYKRMANEVGGQETTSPEDVPSAMRELLESLKQSEIANVVTHGLNPDVPMKDSGIPWIGMIPEHWKTRKIKFLFKYC